MHPADFNSFTCIKYIIVSRYLKMLKTNLRFDCIAFAISKNSAC